LQKFEYRLEKNVCLLMIEWVSPIPDILTIPRDPEDDFLVLASDGIWDVMTNEEACAFISKELQETDDLNAISSRMIDHCREKVVVYNNKHCKSEDNMTITLVKF